MRLTFNKSFKSKNNMIQDGFGLVDAIVSILLFSGVVTYGLYFSTQRLDTVYQSTLIGAVNKEIQRDIERLKLELWSMNFDSNGTYQLAEEDCLDIQDKIISMPGWKIVSTRPYPTSPPPPSDDDDMVQYWWPDSTRSKVFKGRKVLIVRELEVQQPSQRLPMDNSIASVGYRVKWADKHIHWLSILLSSEAHGWCK